MKNQRYAHVRPVPWSKGMAIVVLTTLFIAGCYNFEFINQPYQSDADSYFEVEIQAWASYPDWGEFYFGVMLPDGWFPEDSTEFFSVYSSVSAGLLIHSESLSQTMTSIDPPPDGYYWWVASGGPIYSYDYTFDCTLKIHTNSLAGTFWLDYMLGDDYQGINYRRSNGHLIVNGTPQACHPEGITLTNQDQVDCFQYNYPGCEQIAGSLTISGSDITSLAGLSNVTSIGGHLDIKYNNSLPNLAGLQNLQYIGGNFTISDNPSLVNLIGLSGLPEIVRNLVIRNNPSLASLGGLTSLTSIGQEFRIAYNPQLPNLSGLETLQSIGGNLTIEYNNSLTSLTGLDNVTPGSITALTIRYNPLLSECDMECICGYITQIGASLSIYGNAQGCRNNIEIAHSCGATLPCSMMPPTFSDQYMIDIFPEVFPACIHSPGNLVIGGPDISSLEGLHQFRTIGGRLIIQNNSILTSLEGLDQLESIGGYLNIYNNDSLTSLEGLDALETIGGYLIISENDGLIDLAGLEQLHQVGSYLRINLNPALTSLEGLAGLEVIKGNLEITDNSRLVDLEGLENLSSVKGHLNISSNPYLVNLSGFDALEFVGGDLTINSNDTLSALNGLESLEEIKGTLKIYGNDYLLNLTGMNGLSSIGGNLDIQMTQSLMSLEGLDNLQTIGNNLWISYNGALTGLDGLQSLESIGNRLYITSNPNLVSLSGLNNVIPEFPGGMTVGYNPNLSACNEAFICSYLSLPDAQAQIVDNALGCNSLMEVGYACGITLPCTLAPELFTLQHEIDLFHLVFPGCEDLTGDLMISGEDITNLEGLNNIRSIWGDLNISGNPSLTSLSGINNLHSIQGSLMIDNNASLTSLAGLQGLALIGGSLRIHNNDALLRLDSLENVQTLGSLTIYSNDLLSNLEGLDNIDTLHGSIQIQQNNALSSLNGLDNLQFVENFIEIIGNPVLMDLQALHNLRSIGGDLTIRSNNALTTLEGLNLLDSIGGSLSIYLNDALASLEGLQGLNHIQGPLSIISNNALQSLAGLDSIAPGSLQGVSISNNGSLSVCHIESICSYLSAPNSQISISGNAQGCTSKMEVAYACGTTLPCAGEPLLLSNQFEVDIFSQVYSDCQDYSGNITIRGADIANLAGLSEIRSIGGNLNISYNDLLPGLDGLVGLESVGGDLRISSNAALVSLEGLAGLQSIGRELAISSNNALQSLEGLDNIDPASIYSLSIVNNGSLSVCDIESICSYLSEPGGLVNISGNAQGCNSQIEIAYNCGITMACNGNPLVLTSQFEVDVFAQVFPDCLDFPGDLTIRGEDITNLDGLSELRSIYGNLNISYNDLLPGLDGLESLESVGRDLIIYSNSALVSLEGLLGLHSIDGALAISSNSSLQSLAGLDSIAPGSINNLSLTNNHLLSTCSVESVCGYLSDPEGFIYISENAQGCKSMLEVAHYCGMTLSCDLYPTHFSSQNEIDLAPVVFPGCEEIYRSISIYGNDIVNLQGLHDIRSIGSYLYINGTRLTDMGGLENLESVGEILKIKENNELQNLDGLEQLQTIGSSLIIQKNEMLTSLEGLAGLASIGQNLTIESNNSLQNLTGLENLDPATISRLIIRYNPMLSECAIESVCGFLANPEANTSITDNQAGCNDRGEVEEACGIVGIAGPEAGSGQAGIDIYPNPASGIVYFRLDLSAPQRIIIRIFDISGREITLAADETLPAGVQIIDFDAAVLPEGLYFCRIVMGDQMETVKMVRW